MKILLAILAIIAIAVLLAVLIFLSAIVLLSQNDDDGTDYDCD